MRTILNLLALLSPREKRRGLLVLIMVIGMALLETAGVASIMPFLAVLGNPEIVEHNEILASLYRLAQRMGVADIDGFLMVMGLLAFGMILASSLYRTLTHYVMNRYIEMRRYSLSQRMLQSYLSRPYMFFLDRHSSDLTRTIVSEVDQVVGSVLRPLVIMIANNIVLLGIIILLLLINPWLALGAAGLIGGIYVSIFMAIRGYLGRLGRRSLNSNGERFMAISEALGGIKDIKLLGREQAYLERFRKPAHIHARAEASNATLSRVPGYVVETLAFGGILLLCLVLLARLGGVGGAALGEILPLIGIYAFAAYRMKPAMQDIYHGFASLRFGDAAVSRLHADLSAYPEAALPPADIPALGLRQEIRLDGLGFSYPNAGSPALDDIDLCVPVGTSLGVVGTTGSGKTTLVDVMLGLLRPDQGRLLVDGRPITDELLPAWQRSLGYVPQDIFLCDSSVAENIAMGIPREQIDMERVIECARLAQADGFISRDLPQAYDTRVGERGVRLSGGQRQRIGIARALYHDPDVLVFDEATSALDTVTESAVMQAIESVARHKTTISIAHRLSTVRHCDCIVLLEQGRIKAMGSFDELRGMDEHFRRLADMQSGRS